MSGLDKLTVNTRFPRITKRLNLAGFAQYMRGQGVDEESAAAVEHLLSDAYLRVWLNHNQEFRDRWLDWNTLVEEGQKLQGQIIAEAATEAPDREVIASYTERLNQLNIDALRVGREVEAMLYGCTAEEVQAIYDVSPELGQWVGRQAWEFVREYRSGRKKVARS